MNELLELGLIDTYRHFYPEETKGFTYFSVYNRLNGGHLIESGCRKDYIIISKRLQNLLKDAVIRSDVNDFPHCPITMFIKLKI